MKKIRFARQEWITIGLILVIAAAACIVLLIAPPGSPQAKWLPKCVFHQWTGLYCPGCGATRALSALLHGDIAASLHDNLLLIPGVLLFCVLIVKRDLKIPKYTGYVVLLVLLAFTILRNIPIAPFTALAPIPIRAAQEDSPAMGSEQPDAADGYDADRQQEKRQEE